MRLTLCLAASALFLAAGCGGDETATPTTLPDELATAPIRDSDKIVAYSSLNEAQLNPVLEAYRAETGRNVELISDDLPILMRRLADHGGEPVADIFFGGHVATLAQAAENNVLRPTYSDALSARVPQAFLDPDRYWYPLGVKARVITYNASMIDAEALESVQRYADLADQRWRGKLCLSSSKIVGNQTLIARLIGEYGARETELMVRGWVANQHPEFFPDDTEMLRAMIDGRCALGFADTSAIARFVAADESSPLAVWTLDNEAFSLVDLSGAGIARHAQNPDGARALLEWMLNDDANGLFAASGAEFPAVSDAPVNAVVQTMAPYVAEPSAVYNLGRRQEEARLLAERARYP